MNQTTPKSEKSANLLVGLLLLGGGIILILLNFSVLPVFGMIIGVLFLVIGSIFLAKHNQRLSAKKRSMTTEGE